MAGGVIWTETVQILRHWQIGFHLKQFYFK